MQDLHHRIEDIEPIQIKDVSPDDTIVNWSLDDFADIVSNYSSDEESFNEVEFADEFIN